MSRVRDEAAERRDFRKSRSGAASARTAAVRSIVPGALEPATERDRQRSVEISPNSRQSRSRLPAAETDLERIHFT